ncbi:MAG: hypothetical protein ACJ75J_10345 [Cytophagaceae bacterium]|jgi:hypothetical protein
MAKAVKHKFRDIKKKLKADLASSIEGVLKKLSASSHNSAKKLAKGAAGKIAKDFVKKLKKDDKAEKPSARKKASAKTTASKKTSSKRPAAKKTVARKSPRKAPVRKAPAPVEETSTPVPVLESTDQNMS